jgi:hypothetical protein
MTGKPTIGQSSRGGSNGMPSAATSTARRLRSNDCVPLNAHYDTIQTGSMEGNVPSTLNNSYNNTMARERSPWVVQLQRLESGETPLLHNELLTAYSRTARVRHSNRPGSCACGYGGRDEVYLKDLKRGADAAKGCRLCSNKVVSANRHR